MAVAVAGPYRQLRLALSADYFRTAAELFRHAIGLTA
jgi:hypothetical protein